MTKVAVALSGGVDSAVVAALLLNKGYEVVGITGKMTSSDDFKHVVENAKRVADKLGIKHYTYDATDCFQKNVINYFEQSYKKGETPNPCIMCNKYIKSGLGVLPFFNSSRKYEKTLSQYSLTKLTLCNSIPSLLHTSKASL